GPRDPHETALAPGTLVTAATVGVVLDLGPRQHRVADPRLRLAVHLDQKAACVRVTNAGGGIGVPGERGTAWAAPRLVLGAVGADGRVVGLLGLPGDDAVLDVDLPRARPGAVDAVGGADDLVVAPAVAVEHVAVAAAVAGDGAA